MAVTAQCGLTLAQVVKLAGRGDRGGGGEAVGEVDWVVMLCEWLASTVVACGDGDGGTTACSSCVGGREGEQGRESEK